VALIDPPPFFNALVDQPVPWGVPDYLQAARAAILAGRPVTSKVRDDLPVEDTFPEDEHAEYLPRPASADFVLAVKNVRALLARIEVVRRLAPEARVVMCARDPYDTIASWRRTFDHLREADIANSGVSRPDNPMLPARDREELAAIAACGDVAERRARFWAWSARRILEHRDGAVLVDYADLVSDPHLTLDAIFDGLDPGRREDGIGPSMPRRHRYLLDRRDREAIGDLCVPLARELGLAVRLPPAPPGRLRRLGHVARTAWSRATRRP
jgi:hypothetical protein